jgi:hypothetical protein
MGVPPEVNLVVKAVVVFVVCLVQSPVWASRKGHPRRRHECTHEALAVPHAPIPA